MRIWLSLLCLTCVACADDTLVALHLSYPPTPTLHELRVFGEGFDQRLAPTHAVHFPPPEAWHGRATTLRAEGLSADGTILLLGQTTFTPIVLQTVKATLTLQPPACPAACPEGLTVCAGAGTRRCQHEGGCLVWSDIMPCPDDQRACVFGACRARCSDECAPGAQRCTTEFGQQTCGAYDDDECWEWGPASLCEPRHACELARCGERACAYTSRACEQAPPPTCVDNQTLRRYEARGTCDQGRGCEYPSVDMPCAHGCRDNSCQLAPCRATCASETLAAGTTSTVVADASHLYYAVDKALYRQALAGGAPETMHRALSRIGQIVIGTNLIYWNDAQGSILSMDKRTLRSQMFGSPDHDYLTMHGDRLLIVSSFKARVREPDQTQQVIMPPNAISRFGAAALDADYTYLADGNALYRVRHHSNTLEPLIEDIHVWGIISHRGRIWINARRGIWELMPDRTLRRLATLGDGVFPLRPDGDELCYYNDDGEVQPRRLTCIHLDSGQTRNAAPNFWPYALVHQGQVYSFGPTLQRASVCGCAG